MELCFHTIAFSSFPIWTNAHLLDEAIRIIAEIGYKGIEILAERPHAYPSDLGQSDRQALKRKLNKSGLKVWAICPLMAFGRNPASPIFQEREDSRKYLCECVKLASDLECPTTIFPPGWSVVGADPVESYKHSCETLAQTAMIAEKLGVQIAIEAIWHPASNLVYHASQAVSMMEGVKNPAVKLMMDTYHVWAENENISEVIEIYGPDLVHVHLEDISPTRRERLIPGKGIGDIHNTLRLLKKHNYNGPISVELWGPEPREIAQDSFDFIHSLPDDFFH
jgi:protein FrlC